MATFLMAPGRVRGLSEACRLLCCVASLSGLRRSLPCPQPGQMLFSEQSMLTECSLLRGWRPRARPAALLGPLAPRATWHLCHLCSKQRLLPGSALKTGKLAREPLGGVASSLVPVAVRRA